MTGDDPTVLPRLPLLPFMDAWLARQPGLRPLDPAAWIVRDAAFAPQMALRDRLIAERPAAVHALAPDGAAGAAELLDALLVHLAGVPGYAVGADSVMRPDGVRVGIDRAAPLLVAGRLVQEDFCLMFRRPGESEHRLVGGILCFPSRWSLAQKMARGLAGVHGPVPVYRDRLVARVQRIFDAIGAERPLWRANWTVH